MSSSDQQQPFIGDKAGPYVDKAKDAAQDYARENPDQARSAIDAVEDMIDSRTGGKFSGMVDKAGDWVERQLDLPAEATPEGQPAPGEPAPAPAPGEPAPAPAPGEPAPPQEPRPSEPAPTPQPTEPPAAPEAPPTPEPVETPSETPADAPSETPRTPEPADTTSAGTPGDDLGPALDPEGPAGRE